MSRNDSVKLMACGELFRSVARISAEKERFFSRPEEGQVGWKWDVTSWFREC